MRFSRHQLFALIFGAGMTTALQAQTRPAPPPPRARAGAQGAARGGGPGGMRRPVGPAAMMINQREQLGLSDDQVTQLQALETANAGLQAPSGDMMQARKELQTATAGEANLDAVRAAMDKVNRIETDMLVARLDARNKARAILTTDQQAKFDAAEAVRPMPAMGGMGGPPGGGAAGGRAGARGRQGAPPPPPVPPAF